VVWSRLLGGEGKQTDLVMLRQPAQQGVNAQFGAIIWGTGKPAREKEEAQRLLFCFTREVQFRIFLK
jgi:hypothetical protein